MTDWSVSYLIGTLTGKEEKTGRAGLNVLKRRRETMLKRWVAVLCCLALMCSCLYAEAEEVSSVYEGTAKGFGGDVTVSVTLTVALSQP